MLDPLGPVPAPDAGDGNNGSDGASREPAASLALPAYAELCCLTNFSFLKGASHPEELVQRAARLGYSALAITDECSMAGVVRAHAEVGRQKLPLTLLIGAQFVVQDDGEALDDAAQARCMRLVLLACSLEGYGNLCQFITRLRRASDKGRYVLRRAQVDGAALAGCVAIVLPPREAGDAGLQEMGRWALAHFMGRCWLGVALDQQLDDEWWQGRLKWLSRLTAIPRVAVGDARMHVRSNQSLQDVLTAIRLNRPLAACGLALQRNAVRCLPLRSALGRLYEPALLEETRRVAARCRFSLDELRYRYPSEVVPEGETPAGYLRRMTFEGAQRRWPQGTAPQHQAQIDRELALIAELGYEHYFLTVFDIVRFAHDRRILCQGRGSAANSIVCYCLGITEVRPDQTQLLFERFISRERAEPPDIDVDFEHERREEVIQYLYRKYGRDRAALAASVITYRPRSAIRDVGKALGFDAALLDALASGHKWWDGNAVREERLLELGLDPADLAVRQLMIFTTRLMGFPRHLSQHTGGFVFTSGPLSRLVPIENASMKERTVIEWDKDDLDTLHLLKVDVLALGMLTALRKAMDLYALRHRLPAPLRMQDIPPEDPETYDMICAADTIGVFQIESRAQQSMLPRLQPRGYYDLVVEVAIVRPGPIQGGMVHPYLAQRDKERKGIPLAPIHPKLRNALARTLGIPIFQEQVMQVAIDAAGFTPGQADELRRNMAAWRRKGNIHQYYGKLVQGLEDNGLPRDFAERLFRQIEGFGEYGFPESHAASFALLVYVSCWLKRHEPAIFLAALLNSQPLGFYTPSQLVQDARRHGVEVRPVDVSHSAIDCTLEQPQRLPQPAVRLGLRMVGGLAAQSLARIVQARGQGAFADAEDLALRAGLPLHEMKILAAADALASLSGHRRQQVWDAAALHAPPALLRRAPVCERQLSLAEAPQGEEIVWDYAALGLTLRQHPMALLRARLGSRHWLSSRELAAVADGQRAWAAGIVTLRQQPSTARGTIFVSLEDEHGTLQVIVWKSVREAWRQELLAARLLGVQGQWQKPPGQAGNLVAERLYDLTPLLGRLPTQKSRDFK